MALVRQQGLYESYLEEVERLERERKPGAGYFGLKGGPADDPCHRPGDPLQKSYRRSERMPAQIKLIKALKAAAK